MVPDGVEETEGAEAVHIACVLGLQWWIASGAYGHGVSMVGAWVLGSYGHGVSMVGAWVIG